jgi:squalene-hopene/tetraprenyl-beta-curcumene cyclase
LQLQNRDGGIPTFCRGWGALPFDRSSADISAHAIRAWLAWESDVPPDLRGRLLKSTQRALAFLEGAQRSDGSWLPLWFGNQHAPDDENPTYGTARVLHAVAVANAHPLIRSPLTEKLCRSAVRWFVDVQNADGGWGGGKGILSSTEETALAVEALAMAAGSLDSTQRAVLGRGVVWLVEKVLEGTWTEASPIGFYFAKLWYYEKLYPLIFTVGALRRVVQISNDEFRMPN